MRHLILTAVIACLFMLIVAPVTFSQTCVQIGDLFDCSGPGNSSSTVVPFSDTMGMIVGDHDTTPYTILRNTTPSTTTFDMEPNLLDSKSSRSSSFEPLSLSPLFAPRGDSFGTVILGE